MGKVPKKPNKRRGRKKTKSQASIKPNVSSDHDYQRFLQASAIRTQIKNNLGDIFTEISPFEESLSNWASSGIECSGTCEIPRLQIMIKWRFHSEITKYPEVWLSDLEL